MTATQTLRIQTETSPPAGRQARPRRRMLLAAVLAVFAAAVALTVWLLFTSSSSQPGPITPISAAAPPPQAVPAPGQANAGSNAGSVDASEGYAQFCENSPVLCGAPVAAERPATGYVNFCQNSPSLCTKLN